MKICKYNQKQLNNIIELLKPEQQDPMTGASYNIELFSPENGNFYKQFLAINESGKVIGCIVISLRLYTAEINFIYVDKEERGKGIAPQLVDYVEKYAKQDLNAEGIVVNAGEDNIIAHKFYKKIGFKEVGKVHDYFTHGIWQIFFHKKL